MTDLEVKLKQILKDEFGCKHIENRSTQEYLGLDSLNCIEFIMHIEDTFKVEIDDYKFEELKNFGEVVKYMEGLI